MYSVAKEDGFTINQVKSFLEGLKINQKRKQTPITYQNVIPSGWNFVWQIDLIDMSNYKRQNEGNAWILNTVDMFSEKAYSESLKTKGVQDVSDVIEAFLKRADKKPNIIHSDNGAEFVNETFKAMLDKYDIGFQTCASYSPESNGQIERFNKTLKTMLFKYFEVNDNHKWLGVLQQFVENYNSSVHSVTGMKPDEVNEKTVDELANKYQKDKWNDKIVNKKKYEPGDVVRILLPKDLMHHRYGGRWSEEKYNVIHCNNGVNGLIWDDYQLADKDGDWLKKKYLFSQLQLIQEEGDPKEYLKELEPPENIDAIPEEIDAQIEDEEERKRKEIENLPIKEVDRRAKGANKLARELGISKDEAMNEVEEYIIDVKPTQRKSKSKASRTATIIMEDVAKSGRRRG